MKQRLPRESGIGRINTEVRSETYRNVILCAAETGRTVSSAVDWLLRKGLTQYLREQETPK